ncbi:PIN domain-containing protein [Pseudactinotalea sp. HY160]|uniref:type II toxin-antitoxin system VapC family toxin n=1 Tax=Pseudactinotalea sp. HY160 TaxID=2654490 RepID=UPI00128C528C|nr:type II toxin-antitoxin system VapC family toxin [Pseudactinotalea sp. HY160]MPV50981.1 PIN domain-containing protein [Pseudactinotalea sp. HY160]
MGVTYLLDTHTFVWLLGASRRIPSALRAELADRNTRLLVSAVSAMEVATKVRLGKFDEAEPLLAAWSRRMADIEAEPLDLTTEHALYAGSLRWDHRDPFDRLLAGQAIVENIPLVTRDSAFATLTGLQRRW